MTNSALQSSAISDAPPVRILVAGIGNIFLGDDAFGVEVARILAGRNFPANVRVVDFGIRGIDLTYALVDGCDIAILIDAVPRGNVPGTLYLIEPEPGSLADAPQGMPVIEMHNLDPQRVLQLVASLGGKVRRVLLVGCEPLPIDPEADMQMELSPAVATAVPEAAKWVESLIEKISIDEGATHGIAGGGIQFQGDSHGTIN